MNEPIILIVEDERIIAKDIQARLQRLGYPEPYIASAADEALDIIKQKHPNLILMDIILGKGPDGIEATEEIHQIADIPTIYMTAHSDPATLERAKKTEPYGYIIKPFQNSEVKSAIEMALYKHAMEMRLKESEERYRRLAENARDMIYRMSIPDGIYEYVSPSSERVTGYAPQVYYDTPVLIRDMIHPDWMEYFKTEWAKLIIGDMPETYEYQIIHPSGEVRWLNQRNTLIRNEKEEPIAIEGVVTNVTELKETEQALRKSEERYRGLVHHLSDVVIEVDAKGMIQFISPQIQRITGHHPKKVMGKLSTNFIHPEDRMGLVKALKLVSRAGETYLKEFRILHVDGHSVWVSGSARIVHNNGDFCVVGVIRDITQKKEAEKLQQEQSKALERARIEWENIFQAIGHPTMIIGPDHEIQAANRAAVDSLKTSKKKLLNKKCHEIFHIPGNTPACCPLEKLKKTGQLETTEMEVEAIGGDFLISCTPVFDSDGQLEKVIHIATDITDRKKAESALQESEEKYRHLMEQSPIAIEIFDNNGILISVNKAWESMWGSSARNMVGKYNVFENKILEHAGILPLIKQAFGGKSVQLPDIYFDPEISGLPGSARWIRSHIYQIFDNSGEVKNVIHMMEDITQQKHDREAVLESEKKYKNIVEKSLFGVYIVQDHKVKFCNQQYADVFGYDSPELLKDVHIQQLVHEEDWQLVKSEVEARLTGKKDVSHYRFRGVKKNGDPLKVEVMGSRISYQGLDAVQGTIQDITEKFQAEIALKESEEKYRTLVENSADAIFMVDKEGKLLSFNEAALGLVDKSRDQIIGLRISDLFPKKIGNAYTRRISSTFESGKAATHDGQFLLGKKELWISTSLSPVKDSKGQTVAVIGMTRDVTEKRKSEEKIRTTLEEKVVLLKEVHHRVKNNLQIISSLLNLQATKIDDEATLAMFDETRNRVRSMALVHDELYHSQDFANVDFSQYIRNLIKGLYSVYNTQTGRVELKVVVEQVSLGMDIAIPCGLLINELISNALKHAFPSTYSGRGYIQISLKRLKEKTIEIVVKDNGIGLPKDFDIKKTESLGLHLVTILAEDQLLGDLNYSSRNGTRFRIRFPIEEQD